MVMNVFGVRKRVLVISGSGFLGSYLCERLLNDAPTSFAGTTSSPAAYDRVFEELLKVED